MDSPGVLESTQIVIEQAQLVKINHQRIAELCSQWSQQPFITPPWDEDVHWTCDDAEELANYILVLDCLNFCFWPLPGEERWKIKIGEKWLGGYMALAAALKHAKERGVPLTNAEWLAEVKLEELAQVFRHENAECNQGQIPLLERRLFNANEVGRVLLAKYDGKFGNAIRSCNKSAVALVELLAREFSSFNDVALWRGQQVRIFKRTQIAVGDLFGSFHGKGLGEFMDIDRLTAYADYRIPQVLRALGVLEYAPALARRVDNVELIEPGTEEEVEIRASMIWAIEYICRELKRLGAPRLPYELDWFLWNLGQQHSPEDKPYHRTRTYFY